MISRTICHLTTVHDALDVRVLYREAMSLIEAGFGVRLIAQNAAGVDVEGIECRRLRSPRNRLDRMVCVNAQAAILAVREKADVYHIHDPELIPLGLLLRCLRRRLVYDVHEDLPKQILAKDWIPGFLRRPVSWLFDRVERAAARSFTGVVAATGPVAARFPPERTVVIRNYPVLSMFEEAAHGGGSVVSSVPVLIYVGGISEERGAVEMVRALEHLDPSMPVSLELVGVWASESLRRHVEGMPYGSKVRFSGWMPPVEVYRRMRNAAIGLVCLHPVPRYVESLPVKLFEYMAAGIPVIASGFPLWREVVEGNECGLTVNPLDSKSIAGAIAYLIENPDEAERMARNGRRAVVEKYNWEAEGERLLALYEKILA